MRITMDGEGRLVIPAEIQEEAGLQAGMPLEIHVHDGKVQIEAVETVAMAAATSAATGGPRSFSIVRGRAGGARKSVVSDHPELDLLIRMAIANRRVVNLVYNDRRRRVEPHDYGRRHGEAQLLVFQLSSEGRSGQAGGWRSLKLASMSDFQILEETFPGNRPAGSHIAWDELYARVSSD